MKPTKEQLQKQLHYCQEKLEQIYLENKALRNEMDELKSSKHEQNARRTTSINALNSVSQAMASMAHIAEELRHTL